MVAVLAIGALLAERGEVTVGEIVSFVAFANLLIAKLDQLSRFAAGLFRQAPVLASFFELLDARPEVADRPGARPLGPVKGAVRYEGVSYRFPGTDQGILDLDFAAEPGRTVALVGPTGAGKITALALLQRMRDPDAGRASAPERHQEPGPLAARSVRSEDDGNDCRHREPEQRQPR